MDQTQVHIVQAIMLVPLLGIMAGITAGVVKMILSFTERKNALQAQSAGLANDNLRSELEALRLEISRLRDTSTQYDVSIQHTLEELQHRVGRLEAGRNAARTHVLPEEHEIAVGNRS